MADETTVVEGSVKFRDGNKWKSRWCVMRKLSPVADCVLVQLYADAGAKARGATCKASLSLAHLVGVEVGFTLERRAHTLALVCVDLVVVLALDSRDRLALWMARLGRHLPATTQYTVLAPAPARLHLTPRRAAVTAGVPPRLLGLWDLAHIRRYGVVEGRFCFEGGSHCGKGKGLHVLITDQAREINRDFDLALQKLLSPKKSYTLKKNQGFESLNSHRAYRPDTRLSELSTIDRSLPPLDFQHYDEACGGEESGAISPYWPSAEQGHLQDLGLGDAASVHEVDPRELSSWSGAALQRCASCMSKLGGLSRSSTAALTPGVQHFSPAWTMEPLTETATNQTNASHNIPTVTNKTDICHCPEQPDRPPDRPPKPTRLDLNLNKNPVICSCAHTAPAADKPGRVGPYENYDVPKLSTTEVDGEYYDTPKRLKECLNNELFQITKSSTSNSVILKKPCGCLLKLGKRRKEPTIVDAEENIQPANCACQRVTDWANNWIKLPYCKKNTVSSDNLVPNKENVIPNSDDRSALYATIDLSRKTRRKGRLCGRHDEPHLSTSVQNGNARAIDIDNGPLANYENLSFALSLEHYENAKDLLRQAGVTQTEIEAISANLRPTSCTNVSNKSTKVCATCGYPQQRTKHTLGPPNVSTNDDYLMMEPNIMENKVEQNKAPPSGYTPMSPISGFALQTLKYPIKCPINRLLDEKSASNPTLCGPEPSLQADKRERVEFIRTPRESCKRNEIIEYRKRSSSADSSRFLEDVKEFESSVGSCGSNSSIETLRNTALEERTATPCGCAADNKHSDADSSEASKETGSDGLALVKRSSCAGAKVAGNRDSSSSNDSGVSSCSVRRAPAMGNFEPRRYCRGITPVRSCLPRRSKSNDPLRDFIALERENVTAKSSSAEAEVPVLSAKPLRSAVGTAGTTDTRSTSSGASDLSDYIETLSICSSHSSTDTPLTMRVARMSTSTLRPRSGGEYLSVEPRLRAT